MTLTLNTAPPRPADPQEVHDLIFGTGGLTWSWWRRVSWLRDNQETPAEEDGELAEDAVVRFVVEDPESDEGSGNTVTIERTLQQILDAAAAYLTEVGTESGDHRDMLVESIGYGDALDADAIMQRAVFGEIVYG